MSRWFLGVDGGQSSTTALIGDESGRVAGVGTGGPCNHAGTAEGRARLVAGVTEAVSAAWGKSEPWPYFEAACFGMSGGPEDKQAILAEILPAFKLVVTNDAVIALAGATAGAAGVITIAGTGSIAFGRDDRGRTARAGGWGYVFGDEGGGFDIARQALRAILRHAEGWGPPTAMEHAFLKATGARNADALLHLFYTAEWPRARVAKLAPLVDEAARHGDPVAETILRGAGAQLADLASSVREQLWQREDEVCICYIGGAFRSKLLRQAFLEGVEAHGPCVCGPPVYGPAAGALLEAYRACGLRPNLTNLPEFKA